MQRLLRTAIAASVCLLSIVSAALAQADPPARVGRIAFLAGTVSFHDADDTQWSPALLNHPITTGGALWTEPNGRAELTVAGNRVRLQGSTELDVVALDDERFRLRLTEGRIDWRAAGVPASQPFEVLTPRGTVTLLEDGDYVIEAGSTTAPTRVAVRSGLAQFTEPDGRVVNVRPGEVGVASGAAPVMLSVVRQTAPPMPPEWAARDRVYVARPAPPEDVPTTVTGYEDLTPYGGWRTTSDYGRVWVPQYVTPDWVPFRYGRWLWIRPWGWTWVDDTPWGFVTSHYGRWVIVDRRWCWMPPARHHARHIYVPAVVGFIGTPVAPVAVGGGRLGPAVPNTPVGGRVGPGIGWFPLGPREVYVPPYTTNRAHILGLNAPNGATVADVNRRVDWVERRGERRDDASWTWANQRHATVVPADTFLGGRPTRPNAIAISADQIARAEVAPVAAPPAVTPPATTPPAPNLPVGPPADARRRDVPGPGTPAPTVAPVSRTPLGDMPTLGRPERLERPPAPGPAISRGTGAPAGVTTVTPLPGAGPKPGQPELRTVPPVGAPPAATTPPPGGTPPAGPTPPSVGAPPPPTGALPPAAVTPPAGSTPSSVTTAPAGTSPQGAPPSAPLPPLRGPNPPPSPKAVEPTPATPPAPTVVAPKPPPAPTPAPTVVAPPPSTSQPLGASPAPPQTPPPQRPVERVTPPPTGVPPAPQPAPTAAPMAPPPAPPPSVAPRPVERLAPPPPPPPSPPPPPPPPPPPAPSRSPAPEVRPTVPPPPPPQPQQQPQQQREDERKKAKP